MLAIGLCVLAALVAVVGFTGVDDVAAHSDQGLMTVEATPENERTIAVTATVRYVNDGDAVPSATVRASATNRAGQTTTPVTLVHERDGRYRGAITVPTAGEWQIAARSEGPIATASTSVLVTERTAPSTAGAPPTTDRGDRDEGDDDDSGIRIAAVAVIVVVLGAAAAIVVRRRR